MQSDDPKHDVDRIPTRAKVTPSLVAESPAVRARVAESLAEKRAERARSAVVTEKRAREIPEGIDRLIRFLILPDTFTSGIPEIKNRVL